MCNKDTAVLCDVSVMQESVGWLVDAEDVSFPSLLTNYRSGASGRGGGGQVRACRAISPFHVVVDPQFVPFDIVGNSTNQISAH